MQLARLLAQLQHVAQDRQAPAGRLPEHGRAPRASRPGWRCSSRRAAARARRADGDPPARAAAGRRAQIARASPPRGRRPRPAPRPRPARPGCSAPRARRGRPRGRPARRPARRRHDLAVLGGEPQLLQPPVGRRMPTEGDDPAGAASARHGARRRSKCSPSRLSTATPPGSSPSKISPFASAIASTEGKNSRCAGAIGGDQRHMRAHLRGQGARSRPHGSCRARTRRSSRPRGRRARLSGTPQ